MNVEKAKQFIEKNARPVELAQYRCLFENGPKAALIDALKPYQNPDGGFGNALEADNWNPNSTPITTNDALITLFETGALWEAGDMAKGIAKYLASGDGFDQGKQRWVGSIPSNLDHPHAIWWEPGDHEGDGWNPSVSLAAFLVCMGEEGPWRDIVAQAFAELEAVGEGDSHTVKCFMLAYGLLEQYGIDGVTDMDKAREAIQRAVSQALCREPEKYGVEYVAGPSAFFYGSSPFVPEGIQELIEADLAAMDKQQMEDGGFDISWQWWTPYEKEFEQARAWWRPRVTMEKLRFYLHFGE